MTDAITTQIDDRFRSGSLRGLVRRGEYYEVQKPNATEIVFRLLKPVERPRARLVKKNGRTVLTGGGRLTQAEVDKELENFP